MPLSAEHIDHIIKDLNYRGIVLEGFQDEVIDHVCSAVDAEMVKGKRFIDAYQEVIRSFGNTSGLRKTQEETLKLENQKTPIMIRNYFTIALRNLSKHSFYTFINVAGLAIGVASCMIIMLYVISELSYDRHHQDADRIYRVNGEIKFGACDRDSLVAFQGIWEAHHHSIYPGSPGRMVWREVVDAKLYLQG